MKHSTRRLRTRAGNKRRINREVFFIRTSKEKREAREDAIEGVHFKTLSAPFMQAFCNQRQQSSDTSAE